MNLNELLSILKSNVSFSKEGERLNSFIEESLPGYLALYANNEFRNLTTLSLLRTDSNRLLCKSLSEKAKQIITQNGISKEIAKELIAESVKYLVSVKPMYTSLLTQFSLEEANVSTLCVMYSKERNRNVILYNPSFLLYYVVASALSIIVSSPEDVGVRALTAAGATVIEHEMLHVVKGHVSKNEGASNYSTVANIVQDSQINTYIGDNAQIKNPFLLLLGVSKFAFVKFSFNAENFSELESRAREHSNPLLDHLYQAYNDSKLTGKVKLVGTQTLAVDLYSLIDTYGAAVAVGFVEELESFSKEALVRENDYSHSGLNELIKLAASTSKKSLTYVSHSGIQVSGGMYKTVNLTEKTENGDYFGAITSINDIPESDLLRVTKTDQTILNNSIVKTQAGDQLYLDSRWLKELPKKEGDNTPYTVRTFMQVKPNKFVNLTEIVSCSSFELSLPFEINDSYTELKFKIVELTAEYAITDKGTQLLYKDIILPTVLFHIGQSVIIIEGNVKGVVDRIDYLNSVVQYTIKVSETEIRSGLTDIELAPDESAQEEPGEDKSQSGEDSAGSLGSNNNQQTEESDTEESDTEESDGQPSATAESILNEMGIDSSVVGDVINQARHEGDQNLAKDQPVESQENSETSEEQSGSEGVILNQGEHQDSESGNSLAGEKYTEPAAGSISVDPSLTKSIDLAGAKKVSIPWQRKLRTLLSEMTGVEIITSDNAPSRRIEGVFEADDELPSIGSVCFLIDVSGSMSFKNYQKAVDYLFTLFSSRVFANSDFYVGHWNTELVGVIKVKGFNDSKLQSRLKSNFVGGGNNLTNTYTALKSKIRKPDVILVLGDNFYNFPDIKTAGIRPYVDCSIFVDVTAKGATTLKSSAPSKYRKKII